MAGIGRRGPVGKGVEGHGSCGEATAPPVFCFFSPSMPTRAPASLLSRMFSQERYG